MVSAQAGLAEQRDQRRAPAVLFTEQLLARMECSMGGELLALADGRVTSREASPAADTARPRVELADRPRQQLADPPEHVLTALGPPPPERVARERWEREARRLEALGTRGAKQQPASPAPAPSSPSRQQPSAPTPPTLRCDGPIIWR